MKVSMALKIFRDYQRANLRPTTVKGYRYLMNLFEEFFGAKDISSLSSKTSITSWRSSLRAIASPPRGTDTLS